VKLISFSIAILWWSPAVSKQQTSPPLTLFMHSCSHYQGSTGPGKRRADSDNP